MHHSRVRSSGFTLVENILYMGIFAIIVVMLTSMLISILDAQQESQTYSSVQQDGTYTVARLMYDIARAQDIVVPSLAGQTSPTLQLSIDGSALTYMVVDGNFIIEEGTAVDVLDSFGSSIENVQFTRIGNLSGKDTVRIEFSVKSTTLRVSGEEVREFATTVGLR